MIDFGIGQSYVATDSKNTGHAIMTKPNIDLLNGKQLVPLHTKGSFNRYPIVRFYSSEYDSQLASMFSGMGLLLENEMISVDGFKVRETSLNIVMGFGFIGVQVIRGNYNNITPVLEVCCERSDLNLVYAYIESTRNLNNEYLHVVYNEDAGYMFDIFKNLPIVINDVFSSYCISLSSPNVIQRSYKEDSAWDEPILPSFRNERSKNMEIDCQIINALN
jgi:hypothetical protein